MRPPRHRDSDGLQAHSLLKYALRKLRPQLRLILKDIDGFILKNVDSEEESDEEESDED